MNFIDYNQLYQDVKDLSRKLPEIDAVIGVPRSGMLPASMLATLINKPLGSINPDGSMVLFKGGTRDTNHRISTRYTPSRLLILDDSCDTGRTLHDLRGNLVGFKTYFAAVYSSGKEDYRPKDLLYSRVLSQPRMFAWNFMNHGLLTEACVDIDGVLCDDPPEDLDEGPKYHEFITTVKPIVKPKFKVKYLVTGRLEGWRPQTVQWLVDNGIQYEELIMFNSDVRRELRNHGVFKRDFYKSSGCKIFIESSEHQAKIISEVGPVICVDTLKLYDSSK